LREELLRRFVIDLNLDRMTQVEAGEAARLIEERERPGTTGGVQGAEIRLLGALRYGPRPGLVLADALDAARRAPARDPASDPASDPAGEAARRTLRRLHSLVAGPGAAGEASHASLIRLDEGRLRTLAATLEDERFSAQ
jgi:hypothetical protein